MKYSIDPNTYHDNFKWVGDAYSSEPLGPNVMSAWKGTGIVVFCRPGLDRYYIFDKLDKLVSKLKKETPLTFFTRDTVVRDYVESRCYKSEELKTPMLQGLVAKVQSNQLSQGLVVVVGNHKDFSKEIANANQLGLKTLLIF